MRDQNWYKNVRVVVFYNGAIYWLIRSNFVTTCSMDMTFFPLDEQHCNIDVGLQIYADDTAKLTACEVYISLLYVLVDC